jgi:hypothetical protein
MPAELIRQGVRSASDGIANDLGSKGPKGISRGIEAESKRVTLMEENAKYPRFLAITGRPLRELDGVYCSTSGECSNNPSDLEPFTVPARIGHHTPTPYPPDPTNPQERTRG